jgi:hypothetical protein
MTVDTFRSPRWPSHDVSVFHPAGVNAPRPVIFFSHGFYATNPAPYMALIEHIVSRGYVLVYSPYPTGTENRGQGERYETLFAGFEEAVQRFPQYIDATQVGFMGHSFGGGATPAMAWRGLVNERWGEAGAFLFLMAPYYSYEITQQQLQQFPPQVQLIVQVYDDDSVCDHRMAKDILENINIPISEKDYIVLSSDLSHDYPLIAQHGACHYPNHVQLQGVGPYFKDLASLCRYAQVLPEFF